MVYSTSQKIHQNEMRPAATAFKRNLCNVMQYAHME